MSSKFSTLCCSAAGVALVVILLIVSTADSIFADSPVGKVLQPFVDSGSMPGVVSILSDKDGNLTIDCVGWADVEKKIPMTPDKMFWIASMSKQMTAACVMMLVDEGKLSLDDPVEKYIPEMANVKIGEKNADGSVTLRAPKTKMTLRQVLCHTAGWPFLTPQMQQFGIGVMRARVLASTSAMVPLLSEPGTKYQYSNIGIDIASAVVEVVSGVPFEDFIQQRLFDPLEMKDATFWPNEEQKSRLVSIYRVSNDGPCCIERSYPFLALDFSDRTKHFAEGGGGIFSTPADVIHFFQMIAAKGVYKGKRILSEKSVETFASKQTDVGVGNNYSLGMRIEGDWFGHDGALQTDGLANYKTGQARLYFVQITGVWNPPVKRAWIDAANEVQVK